MKSTYGTRASICAHFHWTLDYLENSISWAKVIRLMADMPSYDTDDEKDDKNKSTSNPHSKNIKLSEQNASEMLAHFK